MFFGTGLFSTTLQVGDVVRWDVAARCLVFYRDGDPLYMSLYENGNRDNKLLMRCIKSESDFFEVVTLLCCTHVLGMVPVRLQNGDGYRFIVAQ